MSLTHRLLYLLGIGVDDNLGAFSETQKHPSALKDMSYRQKVHYAVFLGYVYHLIISPQCCMKLPVSKHNALAVACCSACIENIAQVVIVSFGIQLFYFRLARTVCAKLQKLVKIYCILSFGLITTRLS